MDWVAEQIIQHQRTGNSDTHEVAGEGLAQSTMVASATIQQPGTKRDIGPDARVAKAVAIRHAPAAIDSTCITMPRKSVPIKVEYSQKTHILDGGQQSCWIHLSKL